MWVRGNPQDCNVQIVLGCNLSAFDASASNPNPNAKVTVGGSLSVLGDVNITGRYIVNGRVLSNANVVSPPPVLAQDDVFIGGSALYLSPNPPTDGNKGGSVYVGYNNTRLVDELDSRAVFRVFQPDEGILGRTIARFGTLNSVGYVELASSAGTMRFGVTGPNSYSFEGAATGGAYKNIMSFVTNSDGERFMSFNTDSPTAQMHVVNDTGGCNLARFTTRVAGDDGGTSITRVDWDKEVTDGLSTIAAKRWSLRGPDEGWCNKFAFCYGSNSSAVDEDVMDEVVCITSDGNVGIGQTQPMFALDVKASRPGQGSLRLLNDGDDPAPQILLQSGSPEYGADDLMDYRLYTSNNHFIIDGQNSTDRLTFFDCSSNGHIGILTTASESNQLTVAGSINITKAILLDGNPLFSTESANTDAGFNIKAVNIFFRPAADIGGGIVFNLNQHTGNLFHIRSGSNANMLVLDSVFDENQVHFRAEDVLHSGRWRMYRMYMQNNTFGWKYNHDAGTDLYVSSSNAGYCNALFWQPSTRTDAAAWPEFDLSVQGCLGLDATVPQVFFGCNAEHGVMGGADGDLFIEPTGSFGLGTRAVASNVFAHVLSSNQATLRVQQVGTADRFQAFGTDTTTNPVVVSASGFLGLGTTEPAAALDVQGSALCSDGSPTIPAVGFSNSQSTGWFSPAIGSMAWSTAGAERARIDSGGNVGIGTSQAAAVLDVVGARDGRDVVALRTSVGSNVLSVAAAGNVGIGSVGVANYPLHVFGDLGVRGNALPDVGGVSLGSSTARWNTVYVTSNGLDVQGTRVQQTTNQDGVVVLGRVVGNTGVFVGDTKGMVVADPASNTPLAFFDRGASNTFVPLVDDCLYNTVSLGLPSAQNAARVHVVATGSRPVMRLEQWGTGPVLQLCSNASTQVTFTGSGNVGIGSTLPLAPLEIATSNASVGLRVRQKGAGPVVQFENSGGVPFTVASNGSVGVGTSAPRTVLDVAGTLHVSSNAEFDTKVNMHADLEVDGNVFAHANTLTDSDSRLKSDLEKITGALDKVCALNGYTFARKGHPGRSTGLVAQEVEAVMPEAVQANANTGLLSLAYGNLVGLLVEAIKELRALHDTRM